MSLSAASDFKTARGSLKAIATLSNWHSKHFRYQALDGQAHAGVLTGQRCQRTSHSTDDVPAVSFNVGESAEVLVHHLADHRHARAEVSGGSFSARQFDGESPAGLPKYRLDLIGRQPICECVNQTGQQRDVRARQELFDLRRELEHMRWSCRARALTRSLDDAIALHSRELRTYRASRESQLGCDVVSSQAAAAAKQSHDAAAAGVEKLLSEHGHTSRRSLPKIATREADRYIDSAIPPASPDAYTRH
jgi:hypothetical protein